MKKIANELFSYWKIITCMLSSFAKFPRHFNRVIKRPVYASMSKTQKAWFVFCNLFLSAYITFVTYISHSTMLFTGLNRTIAVLITSLLLFIFIYYLVIYLCFKFQDKSGMIINSKEPVKIETVVIFAVVCWAVLLLSLLANFPGGKSYDTEYQWNQVQNFRFNDWHPVIHTLLIWIVSRMINHYAFFIFVQITVFSIGVGYLVATLESWGLTKKPLLILGMYIILNPQSINIMMYAWKDLALTILLTYTAIMMINIYLSDGKWFYRAQNIILFAITTALAAMVRHNGIFFIVPLYFVVIFLYSMKSKKSIIAVAASILVIFLVKIPLYSAIHVEYPHNTYIESVGIPMTILGDTLVKNPDRLPPEAKEFLYKIASDTEWREKYTTGDYNSIKFVSNASDIIERVPPKQFFKMVWRTAIDANYEAFHAFCELTDIVWKIDGSLNIIDVPNNQTSRHLIKNILNICFRAYTSMFTSITIVYSLFTNIGLLMLLLLISGIFSLYKKGTAVLLLVVPSVIYNLGTMMLLAGSDIRFFHFNVVITVPLIFVLLSKPGLRRKMPKMRPSA